MSTPHRDMEVWHLTRPNRGVLFRRLLVLILLIDLAAMVVFARSISGDFASGFYWPHSGMMLFPVPLDMGSNMLPVTVPLNSLDQIAYLLFISNGIWIAWSAIALLYVFYPLFRRVIPHKS